MFKKFKHAIQNLSSFESLPEIDKKLNTLLDMQKMLKKILDIHKRIMPYVYDNIFEQLRLESKIREIYLTELFKDIEDITLPLGAIDDESGHANHVNLLYVCAIAKFLKCKNIFEFGTLFGRTTYYLTFASEDTKVITLDLPPEYSQAGKYLGCLFKGSERESRIIQLLCDSRNLDTTPFRKKMDLIFIDGGHSYDILKNDTEKAFEMLAPGGTIIWDDYEPKNPDVVKFFNNFTQKHPVFQIKKTCLILYIDGMDVFSFKPYPRKVSLEWIKHNTLKR